MKLQYLHRAIFCTYWLYFSSFRGILGGIRILDYLSILLVPIGLVLLISSGKLTSRMIYWVTLALSPIAITVLVDPSAEIIIFMLKTYIVTLYLVVYFKTMKLTIIELICFAFPFVISLYYFLFPSYSQYFYLYESRMTGISEPNFTSLSLIISLCSAFGIYMLTRERWQKLVALSIAFICFLGVLLTASRAGFVGMMIALCFFLLINKKKWYAGIAAGVTATTIILSASGKLFNVSNLFDRFQLVTTRQDLLSGILYERPYMEYAWNTVQRGEWFIGGGPSRVGAWGARFLMVPHNSLLDIGVAFGKVSFYFYCTLVIVLLFINIYTIATISHLDNDKKIVSVASLLFLSLLPMYMFLSIGLAMDFILWLILGVYSLFHHMPKFLKISSRKNIIYNNT